MIATGIPLCASDTSALRVLHVFSAGWSGTIPPQLSTLRQLIECNLSSNKLEGTVPHLSADSLALLNVSRNRLTFQQKDCPEFGEFIFEPQLQVRHTAAFLRTGLNGQWWPFSVLESLQESLAHTLKSI